MTQRHRHNSLFYRLELWVIRLRDMIRSPAKVIGRAGVRTGMTIVDFGCGPGGFSLAAARRVGPSGRVYAVDIQPLAIRSVQRAAAKQGLDNIQTMVGDDLDRVAEESVDMALVYDVLHILPKSASVRTIMMAIRRVLKSNGVLSVRDHHLSELSLTTLVTKDGLFEFFGHDRGTFRFEPTGMEGGRP